MISYPAEILARFGRYEAVENLGLRRGAELWRSWDPFLERFVLVVALIRLDQAELFRLGPNLEEALDRSLGDRASRRRILDFAPPTPRCQAFFVVEWGALDRTRFMAARTSADTHPGEAPRG